MQKKRVPKRLWGFGLVAESKIMTRMACGQDCRTGYEKVTGQTADISAWLDFGFYDLVYSYDRPNKPDVYDDVRRLARWLGISHRVESDMCYWLITESQKLISKTSVEHVTLDDMLASGTKQQIDIFNMMLEERLDDASFMVDGVAVFDSAYLDDIKDDQENPGIVSDRGITPTDEDYGDMITGERPKAEDEEAVDKYLNVELILDFRLANERRGRVAKRSRGLDGKTVGRAHAKPFFDTREYNIEFTDGSVDKYTVHIITENMFAQVYNEGNKYLLRNKITYRRKDNTAITISDGMTCGHNGNESPKITTRG